MRAIKIRYTGHLQVGRLSPAVAELYVNQKIVHCEMFEAPARGPAIARKDFLTVVPGQ